MGHRAHASVVPATGVSEDTYVSVRSLASIKAN